jgi:hypothetical protein
MEANGGEMKCIYFLEIKKMENGKVEKLKT